MSAALGKAIASVPESKVMDVYNTFAKLLGDKGGPVGANLMSINSGDATAAYKALLEFKDVVKAAR